MGYIFERAPIHCKQASNVALPTNNFGEIEDVAIVSVGNFASMRACDMHACMSKNVTRLGACKDVPRRFRFYLENQKNDMLGERLPEEREFMLPCCCMQNLSATEKLVFKRLLKADPHSGVYNTMPLWGGVQVLKMRS